MSLTTDIATMVARYEALAAVFDGKKNEINAAVNAAVAALPGMARTYFVDAVNGNDANSGLTEAAALQTINRAFTLAGPGRDIEIKLMSDYVMTSVIGIPRSSNVSIVADGYDITTNPDLRRKLTLSVYANANASVSGDWQMTGFRLQYPGSCFFDMTALEIVMPDAPAGTATASHYNGVLSQNAVHSPAFTAMQMRACNITLSENPAGWMLGLLNARTAALVSSNVTYDTNKMAGRWISGVAAGTVPSSSNRILSNLGSL